MDFVRISLDRRRLLAKLPLALGLLLLTSFAVWLASFVPNADWFGQYDAAARGVFQGRSPYDQKFFPNPPWTALLLTPFVILPPNLARGLVLVSTVAAWIYIGWRLRAPKLAFIAMLLSPTAIGALLAANVDAFVLLGAFLPPTWGLFLLMMKPQVGSGAAVYHLVDVWRERRLAGVALVFAPIAITFVVSALLFKPWVDRTLHLTGNEWNRSMFPYAVPVGLLWLWMALRRRNIFWALASTTFLTPYLSFPSYLAVQIGLLHVDVEKYVRRDVLQVVLCVVLWIVMLTFKL
jgi:hypothetical protein